MRFGLLLMTCWLAAAPVCAQEEAVRTIPFDGMEVFCHILNYEKLAPVTSFHDLTKNPRQSVLILFGDPRRWASSQDELLPFLKKGGNLLVATDHAFSLPGIPITVTGKPMLVPPPNQGYRGDSQCPKLMEPTRMGRDHPIFSFLKPDIATNCPSGMRFNSPFLRQEDATLVPFVEYGKWAGVAGRIAIAGSPKETPDGRALIIAGHGMFMNGMTVQTDNDNFNFAINVVRWLREGPNGAVRTKAMFIVDGEVMTNFDVNLTPPPMVPVPPIKAVDRLLHGLEKERFFHRILNRLIGDNRNTVLSVLFAAVTFLLLLYGAKKLMEGRFHLETVVPRMVGEAMLASSVRPVEQRQGALFRQANLGNEARLLARAWFRQEFDIEPKQWNLDSQMAFHIKGWFWGRGSLQRQADRVLQLARTAEVAPMTRREFARLWHSLPRLGDARRAGRLALAVRGETVR